MPEVAPPPEPSPKAGSSDPRSVSRWGQDRRLEFVDFRLRWDGRINRSDLTAFFGISVPQASLDIAKYLDLAPHNVIYDRSSKVYLATDAFKPLYPANHPDRYLNELLARTTGLLQPELSFLGWAPPAASAPSPVRALPVDTLVALLSAIRKASAVAVVYQSMRSTEPEMRTVAPHALGHDGFRWHVRAYCQTRKAFRDFVIARILSIEDTQAPGSDGKDDDAWHRQVRLVLAPNPALTEATRRVIELDYGMSDGQVALDCRQALLFYALKRLGLLEAKPGPANVQQIVLCNREEVAPLLPRNTEPR